MTSYSQSLSNKRGTSDSQRQIFDIMSKGGKGLGCLANDARIPQQKWQKRTLNISLSGHV